MIDIICVVVYDRAPPLPLQCFHGNCFADSIDIINKDGKVYGLKCFLVAEGEEIKLIIFVYYYYYYYCLYYHSLCWCSFCASAGRKSCT